MVKLLRSLVITNLFRLTIISFPDIDVLCKLLPYHLITTPQCTNITFWPEPFWLPLIISFYYYLLLIINHYSHHSDSVILILLVGHSSSRFFPEILFHNAHWSVFIFSVLLHTCNVHLPYIISYWIKITALYR